MKLQDPVNARGYFKRIKRSIPDGSLIWLVIDPRLLHFLVNSAAIFEPLTLDSIISEEWNNHLAINLTAPFLLSQAFRPSSDEVRAHRQHSRLARPAPRRDHFPYTAANPRLPP
ncbi:MAG: hypothetical protein U0X92_14020 [Anaerolineales bacterium]